MPLINAVKGGKPALFTVHQLQELVAMNIANITFGYLQGISNVLRTGERSGVKAIAGGPMSVTRSGGLFTCASVMYISKSNYYVHHANAGDERLNDFQTATQALGAPLNDVSVVYAHPNQHDAEYRKSVNQIISWGVPAAQVLEIANLPFNSFGINNEGRLGY